MKYWSYNEYDPDHPRADPETGGYVVTLSEDEILTDYWEYWYKRMCERFPKDLVDTNYTKQDCIHDWVCINWAWESKP
jgi:hypothetical protein